MNEQDQLTDRFTIAISPVQRHSLMELSALLDRPSGWIIRALLDTATKKVLFGKGEPERGEIFCLDRAEAEKLGLLPTTGVPLK